MKPTPEHKVDVPTLPDQIDLKDEEIVEPEPHNSIGRHNPVENSPASVELLRKQMSKTHGARIARASCASKAAALSMIYL